MFKLKLRVRHWHRAGHRTDSDAAGTAAAWRPALWPGTASLAAPARAMAAVASRSEPLHLQTGAVPLVQKNVQYCEICVIIETLAKM